MASAALSGSAVEVDDEVDGPRSLDRVRIGEALVREGVITAEQLEFALRVQGRLRHHERLGRVIEQLGLVDAETLGAAIHRLRRSLGIDDILLDLGLVNHADLEEARAIHRDQPERPIESILLDRRLIDEKSLICALGEKLGLDVFSPRMEDVDETSMRGRLLEQLQQHRVLPLERDAGEAPAVVLSDPGNTAARKFVEKTFGAETRITLATAAQIDPILTAVAMARRAADDPASHQKEIVELLNEIVGRAHEEGASDIHIEPLANSLHVRFRIDGVLVRRFEFLKSIHGPLISRIKVLAKADIAERRRHQDGRMIMTIGDADLDIRVSFYVSIHGETVVLRVLSQRTGVLALDQLGIGPLVLQRYREEVLERDNGIVIYTGPTGSGKTTTLSSSVAALNDGTNKIITAEDPVEYQIDGVTQCQINPQIGLTYEETLKAIVRQDPDVIVLGEIRDDFSGGVAVQAALTGHKVLTTLHTEDSVGAPLRLLNMHIEPFFVASSVRGIVAQRLVRRVCRECSQPYTPSFDEVRRSGIQPSDARRYEFRRGIGCDRCSFTGYRGRVGFFELLMVDAAVRDRIMTSPTSSALREVAISGEGFVSLREDGLLKAARGMTTLDEVHRNTPRSEQPRDLETIASIVGL